MFRMTNWLTEQIVLLSSKNAAKIFDWPIGKSYGTWYSHVVPNRSTDQATSGLTAEIGRVPVLFTVYGRSWPNLLQKLFDREQSLYSDKTLNLIFFYSDEY